MLQYLRLLVKIKHLCPRYQKGNHWVNQYRSKFHKNGSPLQPGNRHQGQPQAPQTVGAYTVRTSSTPFSLSPASQSLPVEVLGWTSHPEYLSELMNWIPHHHHPVAIPTRIQGPMPPGTIRLILGRSGLTLKGLQILPGLTDPDYSGEIKVMALSL